MLEIISEDSEKLSIILSSPFLEICVECLRFGFFLCFFCVVPTQTICNCNKFQR